jgi:hypothetical protein
MYVKDAAGVVKARDKLISKNRFYAALDPSYTYV